ncbi:MAG TPA: hypothetical protein VFM55_24785 [Micromonosporaceae bacterium]|nr:hypothetical protein [Micromonosporaceae bacterium]
MTTHQLTGASRAPGALVPRAALVAACLLALAAAGCAGSGRGTGGAGQAPGGSGGLGAAPAATTAPPPGPAPATSRAPQHPGGQTTTTTGAATPSGPQVIYFRVAQQPKCPQGTTVYPVPGQPLVLEWKVSGGHEVALSVDNPGVVGSYGRYPLTGGQDFTFSCGGAPGSTEKHTYTLYTVGGGAQRSRTLTVSAVVYEIGSP